jgi:glutamate dehydrogenase
MPEVSGQGQDLLQARLEAIAMRELPSQERAAFLTFLRLYLESSVLQRTIKRSAEDLFAIARHHWNLSLQRESNQLLVSVFNPGGNEAGWCSGSTVIQTVVEDMPFLVDCVTMAIRSMGCGLDWILHPVIAVQRDSRGKVREVSAAADAAQGKPLESLVHIEFSPRLDDARCQELKDKIDAVLSDLRIVVADYAAMKERTRLAIQALEAVPAGMDAAEFAEVRDMLRWLQENHFTFLAYTETEVRRDPDGNERFVTVPDSGLGLLRSTRTNLDPDGYIAPAAEMDKYSKSSRVLVISKGNARSHLHHPDYMDVVSVKKFDAAGQVQGTHRFIGLFSAEAYASSPRLIPVLRHKIRQVIARTKLRENSHAHKAFLLVLETLPRDELIQSSEDELFNTAMGVLGLHENEPLRLFMRRDRYGRYYACMVYMPRDRYSRDLRERIGSVLQEQLRGLEVEVQTQFVRGAFACVYYIVRTRPGTELQLETQSIEQALISVARTWTERLREVLEESIDANAASEIMMRFAGAFDVGYTDQVSPVEAAQDVQFLNVLDADQPLVPRLILGEDPEHPERMRLKLYVRGEPVVLSDILPVLENFGLRVLGQQLDPIEPEEGSSLWVQEFEVRLPALIREVSEELRDQFEEAFLQVSAGRVENDGFNRLVLCAGLSSRETVLLRTVCRYLLQIGLPFSQAYMEGQLAEYSEMAGKLVRLFMARHDPALPVSERERRQADLNTALEAALDQVQSLDADRVMRAFHGVIRASLRTNFFQRGQDGLPKPYVSLKLDPQQIPELPRPRPMYETFVYASEVEGIHLRGGKVARGGLRWSDRREDFRTEVLGLMKAQMVKNAIIVPVGAKGGFVVKKGPPPSEREAWLATGVECYKTFIRGLLDITDNLKDGACSAPLDVVRHDGDDPYLVVAADKGTASFSDIANGLAGEYGFWLADAFASGGSAGYDHKKMGITARGAWESVKRHFRELGKDIQREDFTVVGIGDMSGDVFGNGMLLSRHIRLLAAFDHRHIFIDPSPDPELSYRERERMFKLPRSSWEDYGEKLISKGGGVWSRKLKTIKLSEEARNALGIKEKVFAPNALIHEILKAPVDLLWNGGIGTYVKSTQESHLDVGDRGNDAIRVNGRELSCKVIGEGGNLGLTQLGRIEFAVQGGRLNTDAIDNAGGVHSSDLEVNIKIPLNGLMLRGTLGKSDRDSLLVKMTDAVANAVLEDNYIQSQAVSLLERDAPQRLDEHANIIRSLERDGLLSRALEFLPDEETLAERRGSNSGLTRPELSVLLSYSKLSLYQTVVEGPLPDDPWFEQALLGYFPPRLVESYPDALKSHRLRREIIATILTNDVINRMGMAFCRRIAEELGVARDLVVGAYVVSKEVFEADALWKSIESMDNQLPTDFQYRALARVVGLVKHGVLWALMQGVAIHSIAEAIERYRAGRAELESLLPELLPASYLLDWQTAMKSDVDSGMSEALAVRLANTRVMGSAPDIVELSLASGQPVKVVSEIYFRVGETFSLPWMLASIISLRAEGRWQALARATLRDDAYRLQRKLTAHIIGRPGDIASSMDRWLDTHGAAVRFAQQRIAEIQSTAKADFQTMTVILRELRKLCLLS